VLQAPAALALKRSGTIFGKRGPRLFDTEADGPFKTVRLRSWRLLSRRKQNRRRAAVGAALTTRRYASSRARNGVGAGGQRNDAGRNE